MWACLSFPAGGHLSRLCLLIELFNPLNLQPKHKGSFSRWCERARPPQTQLGFGGQEMMAAWEPDLGQGAPWQDLELQTRGSEGVCTGSRMANEVLQPGVPKTVPQLRESEKET